MHKLHAPSTAPSLPACVPVEKQARKPQLTIVSCYVQTRKLWLTACKQAMVWNGEIILLTKSILPMVMYVSHIKIPLGKCATLEHFTTCQEFVNANKERKQ